MAGIIGALTGSQQRVQFIVKGQGTVFAIDCSTKETHGKESKPTEFPVEDGTSISDHMIVKPQTLQLEGIISDTPLKDLNQLLTPSLDNVLSNSGLSKLTAGLALYSTIQSKLSSGSKPASPSVQAYAQLLSLHDNKTAFDVLTTLTRYEGMRISKISVPRDSGTGRSLMFTLDLVKLILVSPKTVNIQVFANGDLSAAEREEGKQDGQSKALQKYQQGVADGTRAGGG